MGTDHRKSVLVLVASNRRRGAEVFGEHLTAGLSGLGWRVDFVALQSVAADRVVGATTLSDRENMGRLDVSTVRLLRRRIASSAPSVILANGGATLRYAVAARATMRVRPILAYASIGEPTYWLRSVHHTRLQTFLHARAKVVLAVSQMTKSQLVEDLHVDATRVRVAHTGVAPRYFVGTNEPHPELRVVFLGSLSNEKDPMSALDVVRSLHLSNAVSMRFVGDGPLAEELAAQVQASSLEDDVRFTGSVSDVTPHLQWADVLILTSRTEGLPGASLEAAAASVPVVAYDVGGTSETMIDGETGILVDAGDTSAMVAAIEGLAHDRERMSTMGQAARGFIEENFTLDQAIRRYDAILSEAIGEEPTR
jgi:glycosyltransferase involved in cell wall biosynthesis